MSRVEIDLRDGNRERQHSAPTRQRSEYEIQRYRGRVLEMEDVHFHLDSAVMLPEPPGDLPRAADAERGRVGGLAVARACLLHARDHGSEQALVTGHTDARGGPGYNLALSKKRARNVLAVLQGDGDTFALIAAEQHRTRCVQQILRWVAQTQGWDCDPGYVDDIPGDLTEAAIRTFQASYNEVHGAALAVDGIVGRQTFGAIHALYESELALMLENDGEDLAGLRGSLTIAGVAPEGLGCGLHQGIPSARREQYRSAQDRRVEIMFFEPAMLPPLDCHPSASACDASKCVVYRPDVYRFRAIEVEPVPVRRWVSLQTVDELGHAAGGIDLRIEPELGEPVDLTTDDAGYWSQRIIAEGSARITRGDGSAVHLGTAPGPRPERSQVTSHGAGDVVDLRAASQAVTDVIVPGLVSEEALERARLLERRYSRVPSGGVSSARGASSSEAQNPELEVSGRGNENALPSTPSVQRNVADNVFLVAARDGRLDLDRLRRVFAEWVEDTHPELHGRGYLLLLQRGRRVDAFNSANESLGRFQIRPEISAYARFGAYAAVVFPDDPRDFLIDLATESTSINYYRGEEAIGYTTLPEVVMEGESERMLRVIGGQSARRRVSTLYFLPGDDDMIFALALFGGSGRLENYSGGNTGRIHQRNMDMLGLCRDVYRAYLDDYIERVEATTNETELHALGPPRRLYQFPSPAGASRDQILDIGHAQTESAFRAYRAISQKLNEIWGQRGDGTFYVKCEFEFNTGNMGGPFTRAVYKYNFEADLDTGRVYRGDEKRVVAHVDWPDRAGISAAIDPETGEVTQKANLNVGPYGFEVQSNGAAKVSYGVIGAETNHRTQDTFLGAEFGMKDLVARRWRARNPGQPDPQWLRDMPDAKATIGIGFQGLRPGTVLNLVTRSPGFFEMRTVDQMLAVDWTELFWDESSALEELGWEQDTWDRKRGLPIAQYPESAKTDYYDLTPVQKVALTRIPLRRFAADPYWKQFWRQLSQLR